MQDIAISVGSSYYPILTLPGRPKAILDRTAAEIYNTKTKLVNKAVSRNKERFPNDFYFELTLEETRLLNEVPNWNLAWNGGYTPKAFTAKGMNMLSTLLKSEVAVQRSVDIIRAFTALENMHTRDDKWDIITAKIIAAINNRLDDVRISVNKRLISIEDRIAHIEEDTSIQNTQQRSNNERIEEVNNSLTICISSIKDDLWQIKSDFSKAIVDKTSHSVDKCANQDISLVDREKQVVSYIKDHGKITNREYRELFDVPRRTAVRELKDLINKSILQKQGKGRSVFYTLAQL